MSRPPGYSATDLPPDHGKHGAGRRHRAGVGAVDDPHTHRRHRRHAATDHRTHRRSLADGADAAGRTQACGIRSHQLPALIHGFRGYTRGPRVCPQNLEDERPRNQRDTIRRLEFVGHDTDVVIDGLRTQVQLSREPPAGQAGRNTLQDPDLDRTGNPVIERLGNFAVFLINSHGTHPFRAARPGRVLRTIRSLVDVQWARSGPS